MRGAGVQVISRSPGETVAAGRRLGQTLQGGEVILLRGPLGAGKSVFARGIGEALGAAGWRGSPTFVLINEYDTTPALYHVDLYRLSPGEVETLGLEEYVRPTGVVVVEWADRAPAYLAALATNPVEVELEIAGPEERVITYGSGERRDAHAGY